MDLLMDLGAKAMAGSALVALIGMPIGGLLLWCGREKAGGFLIVAPLGLMCVVTVLVFLATSIGMCISVIIS